jgi:hypothetical protein
MFYIATSKDQRRLSVDPFNQTSSSLKNAKTCLIKCGRASPVRACLRRCYQINCQFQDRLFSAISKDQLPGICAINYLAPSDFFCHGIFWTDINYPALSPIIAHSYLLLTFCSMNALSSPPGINHLTHRTQQSRYNYIGAYM